MAGVGSCSVAAVVAAPNATSHMRHGDAGARCTRHNAVYLWYMERKCSCWSSASCTLSLLGFLLVLAGSHLIIGRKKCQVSCINLPPPPHVKPSQVSHSTLGLIYSPAGNHTTFLRLSDAALLSTARHIFPPILVLPGRLHWSRPAIMHVSPLRHHWTPPSITGQPRKTNAMQPLTSSCIPPQQRCH